jgi:hypothetical protein
MGNKSVRFCFGTSAGVQFHYSGNVHSPVDNFEWWNEKRIKMPPPSDAKIDGNTSPYLTFRYVRNFHFVMFTLG